MKYATTRKPLAVTFDAAPGLCGWTDNDDLSPIEPKGKGWELVHVTVVPETGGRYTIDHECGWIYWTWRRAS